MSGTVPALEVLGSAEAAAARAAALLAEAIGRGQVVGLATGGTMVPVYAELVARLGAAPGLRGFGLRGFGLDEYVGLPPEHPASFLSYLDAALARPLGLLPGQIVLPDGMAADRAAAARRHEAAIAGAGGIGLQLLGIGRNGHIGFNEPGSAFDSRTRDVDLTDETRRSNAAFFPPGEAVPARAITAGIGTILAARRLLLLATGPAKAAALRAALEGPVDPACPASALRMHPAATVLCDEAAASLLARGAPNHRRRQA